MSGIYRMPLGFGPAPGPRQDASGSPRLARAVEALTVSVCAEAESAALSRLLPKPFVLEVPQLIVEAKSLRNIGWLAGRGYDIVTVKVPASIETRDGLVTGDYISVLWENRAEPIITGREELGFAKIFGEIDIQFEPQDGTVEATASWDSHQFFKLRVDGLADATGEAMPPDRARFHYKHIPATGRWGDADVSYPVITPPGDPSVVVERVWNGSGRFDFRSGTFEQLPTMDYIVNRLAAITIGGFLPARVVVSRGGKNLSDQAVIHMP